MAAATVASSTLREDLHKPDSAPPAPAPAPEKTVSISDLQGSSISPTLWYRILVFVFDLRHFRHRIDSETRLGHTVDPTYIGRPYFSKEEAEALRNTSVDMEQLPRHHHHHRRHEDEGEERNKEEEHQDEQRHEHQEEQGQQHQQEQQQPKKTLSQLIDEKLVPHEQRTEKPPSERQNPIRGRRGDYRICRASELAPILEMALGIDPNRLGRDKAFLRRLDMFGLGLGHHRRCHALSRHKRLYDPRYGTREEKRSKKPPVQRFGLLTSS
ncbi:hypothetical protein VTN00DRAFT_2030 [Thermoascus crustaceus]|uniref:uncharacterized protein n=1 Tax=Thermoascus crustaceus TaxID=5088 RepID=UPI003742078E